MARDVSFLISEELIRQLSPLSGDLDWDFMTPHLLTAQDKWIQPKLGSRLYEELMTEIKASTLTAANTLLLDDYIAKPMVHWAMYEAMEFLAVKMVNSGIVQRVVDDGTPISLNDAKRLAAKERENAEWYTQRLIDYLCTHKASYPAFSEADPGDIRPEKVNWSGGLNLEIGAEREVGGSVSARVLPTFVDPSNTFAENVAALQEIADIINIDFTATFDKGQILLGGIPTQDRSGLPNNYNYVGTGLPANVPSALLVDIQNLVGYTVLIGVQQWQSSVDYDAGPQPLDSWGDPSGSPLPAGTTGLETVSLEGVYPLFGTTVTLGVYTKQALQSMITGNQIVFPMVAEFGGNKQTFDIPDAWLAQPRPLVDVETYNTFLMAWQSTGLGQWTQSPTTHTVQGNVINYTRFVFNGPDRGAIQIRLIF